MSADFPDATDRPKVLYVIQGLPTMSSSAFAQAIGGAQIQAQRVAELLLDQFDVHVLAQHLPGAPSDETIGGVRVSRVPLSERGGTVGALTILLRLIYAGLRMPRADVVQGFQLNALTLAATCIATLRRSACVIKITGRGNLDRLAGARGRIQLWLLARATNAIVAPSESCLQAARTAGIPETKLRYIPNGVDTNYFQPPTVTARATARGELGYTHADFVFCWIGRFHPLKGLDCVESAWALVQEQCPEARLLLVGDGEEEEVAQRLVTAYPGSIQRLHFHHDVRPFYACADAILLTSRSEGLSNVLLEGMSCGLPAVVSAAPENAEVGEGGDFLVTFDRESPRSIADAVLSLVRRRDRDADLGKAARRHVEARYSLSGTAARWADLYRSLLADHRDR